jgi:hypothetical protein
MRGNRQTKVETRHRSPAYASKVAATAFGTARPVELALSADDASLFRSVGQFHHRCDGKTLSNVLFLFIPSKRTPRDRRPWVLIAYSEVTCHRTIASPCPYDGAGRRAPQSAKPRLRAILRYTIVRVRLSQSQPGLLAAASISTVDTTAITRYPIRARRDVRSDSRPQEFDKAAGMRCQRFQASKADSEVTNRPGVGDRDHP